MAASNDDGGGGWPQCGLIGGSSDDDGEDSNEDDSGKKNNAHVLSDSDESIPSDGPFATHGGNDTREMEDDNRKMTPEELAKYERGLLSQERRGSNDGSTNGTFVV